MKYFFIHKDKDINEFKISANGRRVRNHLIDERQIAKCVNDKSIDEYYKIASFKVGDKVKIDKDLKGVPNSIMQFKGRELKVTAFDKVSGKVNMEEARGCNFYLIDIQPI